MTIADAIAQGKEEISDDIEAGIVPAGVTTFSALHDHVDANEYGGLCDNHAGLSIEEANEVQQALDAWLAAGRV